MRKGLIGEEKSWCNESINQPTRRVIRKMWNKRPKMKFIKVHQVDMENNWKLLPKTNKKVVVLEGGGRGEWGCRVDSLGQKRDRIKKRYALNTQIVRGRCTHTIRCRKCVRVHRGGAEEEVENLLIRLNEHHTHTHTHSSKRCATWLATKLPLNGMCTHTRTRPRRKPSLVGCLTKLSGETLLMAFP